MNAHLRGVCALASLCVGLSSCGVYRVALYPAPGPGDPGWAAPLSAPFEPIETCAADGTRVHLDLLAPPGARARVFVVFHGNGETMENRAALALSLRARGFGVALVEYRGYGVSAPATPDEHGLYLDAAAALEALAARGIASDRLVLMGISLGTGVASRMAECGAGRALVLLSPFTSVTDVTRGFVPWLPPTWLVPDRFDTLSRAPRIHVPSLVVHGDADELIPVEMGREVAAGIPRSELLVVRGGHHNDILRVWPDTVLDAIAAFAAR